MKEDSKLSTNHNEKNDSKNLLISRYPIIYIKKSRKYVTRKPIFIPRKPIQISKKERIEIIGIKKIVKYYDFLSRKTLNTSGFKLINRSDFWNDKNWTHFQRIYRLCHKNKWKYKIYIDAMFDWAQIIKLSWKDATDRPLPNIMYSERAQSYFKQYVKEYSDYSYKGRKLKEKNIISVRQEIIEEIIKDCEKIRYHIKDKVMKIRDTDDEEKIAFIKDNWMELSPYYLSSISWIDKIINKFDNKIAKDFLNRIETIRKSKKMCEIIKEVIPEVENYYDLPETRRKI